MKTLFLAWQDPNNRVWFPVGRLTHEGGVYQFVYTKGAQEAKKQSGFQPLTAFRKLDTVYQSDSLFPFFSNRLLNQSRPDYEEFIAWLNVPQNENDPIALLSRSGGRRVTD